ncbi:TPA: acyltransferase [Vibrio cholerae]
MTWNIKGNKNKIIINDSVVKSTEVRIIGDGNLVLFDKCRDVKGVKLIIVGDGCRVEIQKNVGIGGARIVCGGENKFVTIGENSMLSDNVELWASDGHSIYNAEKEIINNPGNIIIGENVWLGTGVKVLKNVSIGSGTVVGMSSVVTKCCEADAVYVGNPAKKTREKITWAM